MKNIFGSVGKYLGYLFAALIISYTATLNFQVAGRLVPGNLFMQAMTVALFDVAALVWFVMFITQARGTAQWAFALIGWLVGLIGAVILAGGELILGQNLVVFSNPERLGWILIATVIVACITHVLLTYLFHLNDPAVKNRIEIGQKVAEKIARAHEDARNELDRNSAALTAGIKDSVLSWANQVLEAETAVHIRDKNRQQGKNQEIIRDATIIPGVARDVPAFNPPPVAARPAVVHTKGQRPQARPSGNNHRPQPPAPTRVHFSESAAPTPVVTPPAAESTPRPPSPPASRSNP